MEKHEIWICHSTLPPFYEESSYQTWARHLTQQKTFSLSHPPEQNSICKNYFDLYFKMNSTGRENADVNKSFILQVSGIDLCAIDLCRLRRSQHHPPNFCICA